MRTFRARDADIAVRMTRPRQSPLVARRIGETRIGLYAHRDYLARCGRPSKLDDLLAHRLIGYDRDDRSFRARRLAAALRRENFVFRCDSDPPNSRRCARASESAALRRISRGARLNSSGRSRRIASAGNLAGDARGHRNTPRVRAMWDTLAKGLSEFVMGRAI